ncbi:MAG: enoyl-CoA hydratase/isomerase family protein [Sphingobacteriales bacterium]|nr:enoyl-CoA hydratase/isomerase family protein [Sphingobacteriales bacterium]HNY55415.1 enoyl-CoA hydratase-related protein [Chitinophagales bacterium]
MEFKNLLWEITDNILLLTINRADKLNALNGETILEIQAAFTEAKKTAGLKGIIVTGAGEKAFVAGADISEFHALDMQQAKALAQRGHDIFFLIEHMQIPVIAVVNGFALGGGCELSMACHMRVATANAKFGQPEVNLGIIAGYGGTQRLIQYIGKSKALELHLTADMIDAQTALNLGLLNYIETDKTAALEKAKTIINKIATKGPVAVAKVIECTNAYYKDGVDGFDFEVNAFASLFHTEDVKEGVSAFLEKRKPEFKGK